jgi:hypothetical protein
MNTSFTPGKWEVCNLTDVFTENGATNAHGVKCDDNDGWLIADCAVGITMIDGEEHQLQHKEQAANARLIAAAPAMYAALQEVLADYDSDESNIGETEYSWIQAARAAINLATGQEP